MVQPLRYDYLGRSGDGSIDNGVVYQVDTTGQQTILDSVVGGADGGQPVGAGVFDSAATFMEPPSLRAIAPKTADLIHG